MEERCKGGHVKELCCLPGAIDRWVERYGGMWVYHWTCDSCPDGRVAAIAAACDLDPHDLLDAVEDRGYESHDQHFMAAIAWEAAMMLRPERRDD